MGHVYPVESPSLWKEIRAMASESNKIQSKINPVQQMARKEDKLAYPKDVVRKQVFILKVHTSGSWRLPTVNSKKIATSMNNVTNDLRP